MYLNSIFLWRLPIYNLSNYLKKKMPRPCSYFSLYWKALSSSVHLLLFHFLPLTIHYHTPKEFPLLRVLRLFFLLFLSPFREQLKHAGVKSAHLPKYEIPKPIIIFAHRKQNKIFSLRCAPPHSFPKNIYFMSNIHRVFTPLCHISSSLV